MRSQNENPAPDSFAAHPRPIELVTENGFAIVRFWEINQEPPPTTGNYLFLVRTPQSPEQEISVEIADELFVDIELKTRRRVLSGSSFWICCAERRLANYLWEHDECPPDDKLRVERLDPEDLMMAIRWAKY